MRHGSAGRRGRRGRRSRRRRSWRPPVTASCGSLHFFSCFRGRPTTVHPVVAPPYRKSVVFRPSELTKDITITQRKVGIHRISGTFNPHFSKCVHFIPNLFQPSDQFHHVALAGFWANFFFFYSELCRCLKVTNSTFNNQRSTFENSNPCWRTVKKN